MDIRSECQKWLDSPVTTVEEKARIREIMKDPETAAMNFSAPMSFGTAGLRSAMDMGPGCMNVYTVAHITQAMANLILRENAAERGVAIAYDSRHQSDEFSRVSAEVLAANGIRVYLFDDIRPTPELSFAIRELGCIAGINITASHNPKQYNGYKAYWEDGAQVAPAQADVISANAAEIDVLTGAKRIDFESAVKNGQIVLLGQEFDEKYLSSVLRTAIRSDAICRVADTFRVVYTPLHGAGRRLVPEIMARSGLRHIYTVPSQMIPDGDFPTVVKPNPEYADVFTDGIAIANREGSDLIIATDPDADRVGVMCRGKDGSFVTLTGNQMGALLLDYVIRASREKGILSPDDYAVKSIVSTDMAARICEKQGVKLHDVPTGFKYIGEVIKTYEEGHKPGRFLMGFEESYGYLFGTYARDKDAVGATMMICEMAAWYAEKGMTLSDALEGLYEEYGMYREGLLDIYMEGFDGIERRKRVMENLRVAPPKEIAGVPLVSAADFSVGTEIDLRTGSVREAVLNGIDVLYYTLENGDKFIVRPSGTEPKIKMYMLCHGQDAVGIDGKIDSYKTAGKHFCDV